MRDPRLPLQRARTLCQCGPFIQKWADGGVMVPSSAQWQPGVSGEERATSVSILKPPKKPSTRSDGTKRAMTQRVREFLRAAQKKLRSRAPRTRNWN